jgi:hypothetical protein
MIIFLQYIFMLTVDSVVLRDAKQQSVAYVLLGQNVKGDGKVVCA